jgi:hypothetical protein
MACAVSSGARSTPRHCASTRRREDILPDPSGGKYLNGGFKWENVWRNLKIRKAGTQDFFNPISAGRSFRL